MFSSGTRVRQALTKAHIGDASSGIRTSYLGGISPGLEIEDITSQDVMLGVRWNLGSAPAPMPVAFNNALNLDC